jgi:hypothetical protein
VTPYSNAVQVFATRPDAVDAVRGCLAGMRRPHGPDIVTRGAVALVPAT